MSAQGLGLENPKVTSVVGRFENRIPSAASMRRLVRVKVEVVDVHVFPYWRFWFCLWMCPFISALLFALV
jgi:hypothetical protein